MDRVLDGGIGFGKPAGEEAVGHSIIVLLVKVGGGGHQAFSRCEEGSASCSTRRSWRPPRKSEDRKAVTHALAISTPIRRAPSAMALASLCCRASEADSGSATWAQRQAGLRLAAMATPMPGAANADPALGPAVGQRFGHQRAELRIIDAFMAMGAEVEHLVTLLGEPARELVLEVDAGMVGGEYDAHDA